MVGWMRQPASASVAAASMATSGPGAPPRNTSCWMGKLLAHTFQTQRAACVRAMDAAAAAAAAAAEAAASAAARTSSKHSPLQAAADGTSADAGNTATTPLGPDLLESLRSMAESEARAAGV